MVLQMQLIVLKLINKKHTMRSEHAYKNTIS